MLLCWCHYAECRYSERRYAECRGATVGDRLEIKKKFVTAAETAGRTFPGIDPIKVFGLIYANFGSIYANFGSIYANFGSIYANFGLIYK